jgi:hypothetical protein
MTKTLLSLLTKRYRKEPTPQAEAALVPAGLVPEITVQERLPKVRTGV